MLLHGAVCAAQHYIRGDFAVHRVRVLLMTVPVSPSPKVPISNEITASPAGSADDDVPTFFIDTEPTRPSTHRSASDVVLFNRTCNGVPLGEDDELIVYVAPHPRSGRYLPTPDVPLGIDDDTI
jgi:hypothetical protein